MMACLEFRSANADSEMEEGEIIDEMDQHSDISSGEEFLLRQRLEVLESYNNVLERKKAKRSSVGSGKEIKESSALCDLSEISETDLDDVFRKKVYKLPNKQKQVQSHHKHKKSKQIGQENGKMKEHKKKNHHYKKRDQIKVLSETSESDDDYRNKRRKLASAVSLNNNKTDSSTLKDRLTKMLSGNKNIHIIKGIKSDNIQKVDNMPNRLNIPEDTLTKSTSVHELIDLCTDEDSNMVNVIHKNTMATTVKENIEIRHSGGTSDDDLEQLRQHALKTKPAKSETSKNTDLEKMAESEDEDSDTTDLRMICLRSALLKKAIEMKNKQKLNKRLSQSSLVKNNFDIAAHSPSDDMNNYESNTDIEAVDMDIGSDGAEKIKDTCHKGSNIPSLNHTERVYPKELHKIDEIEEDEDLLRAKLLTSLSKNLPNLVDLNVLNNVLNKTDDISNKNNVSKPPNKSEDEKKFIIELGESESEGEHEATKNLTKMHMKLSEQKDFEQKLDLFLKSSRLKVEQNMLPDVIQPPVQRVPEKFIPKAMNHLPKSEQIEYKNLVKRMAELEKIKRARQTSLALKNAIKPDDKQLKKETLRPHNISLNSHKDISINELEEKIALSRKKIAQESAKMLKLRDEAKKLSQRYKIAATELRNITTAITLNKKEQRVIQNGLFKVRLQHQMLLKSSTNLKHTNHISNMSQPICKTSINKSQKENDPTTHEQIEKTQTDHKDFNAQKTIKVSIVNDLSMETISTHPRLTVPEDISNKKTKVPKLNNKKKRTVTQEACDVNENTTDIANNFDKDNRLRAIIENRTEQRAKHILEKTDLDINDYKSPLDALNSKNWEEDPNAFLCPFEVGGCCRDTDCKYLHLKVPSQQ